MTKNKQRYRRRLLVCVLVVIIVLALVIAAAILLTGRPGSSASTTDNAPGISLSEWLSGSLAPGSFNGTWISGKYRTFVSRPAYKSFLFGCAEKDTPECRLALSLAENPETFEMDQAVGSAQVVCMCVVSKV